MCTFIDEPEYGLNWACEALVWTDSVPPAAEGLHEFVNKIHQPFRSGFGRGGGWIPIRAPRTRISDWNSTCSAPDYLKRFAHVVQARTPRPPIFIDTFFSKSKDFFHILNYFEVWRSWSYAFLTIFRLQNDHAAGLWQQQALTGITVTQALEGPFSAVSQPILQLQCSFCATFQWNFRYDY